MSKGQVWQVICNMYYIKLDQESPSHLCIRSIEPVSTATNVCCRAFATRKELRKHVRREHHSVSPGEIKADRLSIMYKAGCDNVQEMNELCKSEELKSHVIDEWRRVNAKLAFLQHLR